MKQREHVEAYSAEIASHGERGQDSFQPWFNKAGNAAVSRNNGFWDFALSIATPEVRAILGNPLEKTALEIGCGGGRLIHAASYFFGQVIGVDIHDSWELVDEFVNRPNVIYERGDGETLPVDDKSVDFIYSFIVFHHLHSLDAFRSYLEEIRRCLAPGGVAHIYYGVAKQTREFKHYQPNLLSLTVSRDDAWKFVREAGLEVICEGQSRRYENGKVTKGYQSSLLLR